LAVSPLATGTENLWLSTHRGRTWEAEEGIFFNYVTGRINLPSIDTAEE
jgi:hypothetical protein